MFWVADAKIFLFLPVKYLGYPKDGKTLPLKFYFLNVWVLEYYDKTINAKRKLVWRLYWNEKSYKYNTYFDFRIDEYLEKSGK